MKILSGRIDEQSYVHKMFEKISQESNSLLGPVDIYENKVTRKKAFAYTEQFTNKKELRDAFLKKNSMKLLSSDSFIQILDIAKQVEPNWSRTIY